MKTIREVGVTARTIAIIGINMAGRCGADLGYRAFGRPVLCLRSTPCSLHEPQVWHCVIPFGASGFEGEGRTRDEAHDTAVSHARSYIGDDPDFHDPSEWPCRFTKGGRS